MESESTSGIGTGTMQIEINGETEFEFSDIPFGPIYQSFKRRPCSITVRL
jgi:hypothetical protein